MHWRKHQICEKCNWGDQQNAGAKTWHIGLGGMGCPPLALLNKVFGFVLCHVSLLPRFLGLQGNGCAHVRDGSRLTLASMLVWNTSQTALFRVRPHCWSRSQGLLHPRVNLVFSYWISRAGRSCFISLCNLSLFKKSMFLLGVNMQDCCPVV